MLYLHFTTQQDKINANASTTLVQSMGLSGQQNARLDQILPRMVNDNMQRMGNATAQLTGMIDPNSMAMPTQPKYDPVHQICQKQIVYFTSRFAILLNAAKMNQSFYQGH